ncbi:MULTISPECIES: M56 family metallopeptidase [unclassified Leeuwenhoekiella]|uniref:M56 family metallopeptidase n=2 Tax=Leeuwenhoekiella TaxID=283735 RepID=UPI000C535E2D|nr:MULTISPECIES: M56 family metallopeptidase [unclassified Leeuwenhoekiella]MAW96410.1 blaR1 peptidase M56 [Leeuwenhoekiella sp.]|tara:strand:- start:18939 stop:20405 length:1467 start_codon:yes stop_codon:yes gene_type:complete
MVRYLLEVFVIQALFLAVYQFWLRKETFFNVNRAYLIGSALVAFALPFMQFELFQNQIPLRENITFLPEVVINAAAPETTSVTPETQTDWSIYWLIYAAGVFFSTGMLFRKYLEVKRYFRFKRQTDGNIITIPNSDAAFTFLNTIFLGDKISAEARAHILAHEEVHLKHKHGVDLFIFEVLRVVFWFNPLVYIYQNKVAELHEFIADAQATKKTEKKSYYNQLLNTAFGTQEISFINTFFNHSLIKKRIVMLQKQSRNGAKWKYLLLLPLIAGILTYVGCTDDNGLAENQTSLSLEEQIQDLRATLDAKEHITPEELNSLEELEAQYKSKIEVVEVVEGLDEAIPLNEAPVGDAVEIIEVVETQSQEVLNDVPFAVVDEVPTFPGCESLSGYEEKKMCMSQQVSQFVNRNFNTDLGKELGLKGVNRIYVRFKIDEQGKVTDIGVRGPHPKLEEEAIRVVSQLPDMTPGKQGGEAVNVLYSLPIVFQVQ